jgi:hypothetical protein
MFSTRNHGRRSNPINKTRLPGHSPPSTLSTLTQQQQCPQKSDWPFSEQASSLVKVRTSYSNRKHITKIRTEHLPAIEKSGLYDIKAVYSRSKKSAEGLIPNNASVDIYSDDSGPGKSLDDLLARKDIQAVDVVLPITHQPSVIKKCLTAGKHVVYPRLAPQVILIYKIDLRKTCRSNDLRSQRPNLILQNLVIQTNMVRGRTIPT